MPSRKRLLLKNLLSYLDSRIAKNLAPYRIGKRPHKQNRAKIPPKYRKSYFLSIFDVFLGYFEGCCVFLSCRGPSLSQFKKALLQNPREVIRGRISSEMIRIQARKSELQAESRSHGPKVGDAAGQTPRIRTESPRKGPRMGFRCFYRNPPLKPS